MKPGHLLLFLLFLTIAGCKAMPAGGNPAAPPTSAQAGATTIIAVAPPAAPQPTLWGFLGLDQLFGAIHAKEMRKLAWLGTFFPGLEPTTAPLRPLADPANMDSPNPAVKAAAEAKADQDAAPQKVKALKFLGSAGCDAHPDIEQALLAGLDDSIEAVRYAAVSALYEAAGNPCETCDTGRCCSPDIRRRLHQIGYEMKDDGCYVEPSARVRRVARLALNACGGDVPPPEPIPDELPPIPQPPAEVSPVAPPPSGPVEAPPPAPAPSEPPPPGGVAQLSSAPADPALELAVATKPMTRRRLLSTSRPHAQSFLVEPEAETGTLDGEEAIALVNGEPIPAGEINAEFAERLSELGSEVAPDQQRAIFVDVVQRAIHDRLLLQEARAQGHTAAVAQLSHSTQAKELQNSGSIGASELASRWLSERIVVDETVAAEELVHRYEHSTTEYWQESAVRWERVRVPFTQAKSRAQADAIMRYLWDRAIGLAADPPPGMDPQIVETQIFNWTTKTHLPSEKLRRLLFELPVGQVSNVLEDAEGLTIVRVLERRPAMRQPLHKVSDQIRAEILRDRRLAAERDYLRQLRQQAEIRTAIQVFPDDMPVGQSQGETLPVAGNEDR